MRIEAVSVEPERNSIIPIIIFKVRISYPAGNEAPFKINAQLLSPDKKIIAIVHEVNWFTNPNLEIKAKAIPSRTREDIIDIDFYAELSPSQIEYLEGLRDNNRKGDLELILSLKVQCIFSRTLLSSIFVPPVSPYSDIDNIYKDSNPVLYQYGHNFARDKVDMWILSGENDTTFLEIKSINQDFPVTIKSSDWIHDFCPNLGIGDFISIEIPKLTEIIQENELDDRIKRAISSITKARENLRSGEWNQVIEDLRGVWELYREKQDKIQDHLRQLLANDNYTKEAIDSLLNSIGNQFTFSSKFMHTTDPSGKKINPEIKASKEDAYFIYTMAMSFLNLLARKHRRMEQ